MTIIRIIVDCILIISAFFFPWWIPMLAGLIAVFYFNSYYEIVVLGVIIDSLYNASVPRFYNIQFVLTLTSILVVFCVGALKERLRFYR